MPPRGKRNCSSSRQEAARGKDVTLGGGANIAQQYLKAGLIDEMEIHVAPVLLGDGARLFDNTDGQQTDYECIRVVNSPDGQPLQVSAAANSRHGLTP